MIEHDLCSAYKWSVRDVNRMDAWEVWQHWSLCRQREARRDLWALTVRGFRDQKKAFKQQILSGLKDQATPRRKRKSPYDIADPEARVLLIGSALSTGGDAWARTHSKQIEWLASEGLTAARAIERHHERLKRDLAHKSFVPANPKPKRKPKKKRKT